MTVRIRIAYDWLHGTQSGYATTLGAGGLFIESEGPPPVRSRVRLHFHLREGGTEYDLEGRVVWASASADQQRKSSSVGFGVQFDDPLSASAIARELEQLGKPSD
jgi:Tfp pilus assembly protein PilZ